MCTSSEIEYPNLRFGRTPQAVITREQKVLLLVAPMTGGGTLTPEAIEANIERAIAMAHSIEATTGHTVLVPHRDLVHLPPPNGKASWEIAFSRHVHIMQRACDGIFQMSYNCHGDPECVALVGWWQKNRSSLHIYRDLREVPLLQKLTL